MKLYHRSPSHNKLSSLSMRHSCQHRRQIAKDKLGWHQVMWHDLITLNNHEFDYNCYELDDMDNSECKANFMLCRRLCISLRDSAILREKKKKSHKEVHDNAIWKIGKKLILRLNLNLFLFFCITWVSLCLQHTFSLSVELTKANYHFRWMELDSWLSRKLMKTTKIVLKINLVHMYSTYFLCFNTEGKTWVLTSVSWRLWRVTSLNFGLEITSRQSLA